MYENIYAAWPVLISDRQFCCFFEIAETRIEFFRWLCDLMKSIIGNDQLRIKFMINIGTIFRRFIWQEEKDRSSIFMKIFKQYYYALKLCLENTENQKIVLFSFRVGKKIWSSLFIFVHRTYVKIKFIDSSLLLSTWWWWIRLSNSEKILFGGETILRCKEEMRCTFEGKNDRVISTRFGGCVTERGGRVVKGDAGGRNSLFEDKQLNQPLRPI